ncbi:tRNA (cytosine(72)-C(5))-methyltransferase NSUN6 [Anthonomus grandis grandis]|uniref:tRNA (cytosine(72)-C(5))-methyltransferase NSUN6 n=1 Tax=Anthonomus grandis grandis TaxID=2921223 RepID=UPI002166317B|nr:tRNA (cytosine(72)-C(5))-methyltransferase NSUN6 [Anthonomus grandis grandis]
MWLCTCFSKQKKCNVFLIHFIFMKMPYPKSPFSEDFNTEILISSKEGVSENYKINVVQILEWLCTAPTITSYRVNTLKAQKEAVIELLQNKLNKMYGANIVNCQSTEKLDNTVLIKHLEVKHSSFVKYQNEIIVDTICAAAVLRGANIYAPGVLGMVSGTQVDDKVSIYADLNKKCKKGLLNIFLDPKKIFIGNGIVKMTREQLFGENLNPTGVAIEVFEVISGCPPLGDFLPPNWALLQNIPSIVCVQALNPQKGELILDMCASPGNKTTHIAALVENDATIIAIDKTPKKVEQLKNNCNNFGANVSVFQADSCKICSKDCSGLAPPFLPETFDRILLDAPCSVLGKRPQFRNTSTEKMIKSYVPLQRKLFSTAVALLKPKGTMVYSTCTITLAENEGMVAWALKNFDCLELVKPEKGHFGGPGWCGTSLSESDKHKVLRFGPGQEMDSIGFFISCFVKKF